MNDNCENVLNAVYASDDNFAMQCGVSMISLLENNMQNGGGRTVSTYSF